MAWKEPDNALKVAVQLLKCTVTMENMVNERTHGKERKTHCGNFLVVLSAGCASMDQYKAVGFDSPLQLFQYAEYTQYYGMRLNADDWRTFCERFPDLLAGGNRTPH